MHAIRTPSPPRARLLPAGLLAAAFLTVSADAADPPAFVPWPREFVPGSGACVVPPGRRIVYQDASLKPLAAVLADEIRMATGVALTAAAGRPAANGIALRLDGGLARESYVLTVAEDGVSVVGQNYNAVAMGTATLLQVIGRNDRGEVVIPAGIVRDACFAEYNALMVDIAREEHSMEDLRDLIDMCRFYKIRFFRLHFSDDNTCLFPFAAFPQTTDRERGWKIEDIRALVRYADERGVTLVPELETPGHCTYLCHRMPEVFGKGPGMDPTQPRIYEVLEVMIGEIAAVFRSSPYIHIGCDEARVHTDDRSFLERHGLKDDSDLFAWHVARMNAIVKKHGKRTMAWECPSTDKDVISTVWNITSRRGEDKHGETANTLKAGRPVVQVSWEPGAWSPVEELYDWRPYGKQQQFAQEGMLGSEMVFWQNHGNIALRVLRWKAPVRSEVTWNPVVPDPYDRFAARFARSQDQFDRVATGLEIRMGDNVDTLEDWLNQGGKDGIGPVYQYTGTLQGTLLSSIPEATIRYLLEDKESWKMPDGESPAYDPSVLQSVDAEIGSTTIFKARLFDRDGRPLGRTLIREFHNNPFTVEVAGAVRKGDDRFSGAMVVDVRQHIPTGTVRYQLNGPVTAKSPPFTKPFRITRDATVTVQYFDESGDAKGAHWRMLAKAVDFDPYSLTYHKPVAATVGAKEFIELAVDGLVDRNECLNAAGVKQVLTVDLGKSMDVDRVVLHTFWNPDDGRAYRYKIELSEDNENWITVVDAADNQVAATPAGYRHAFEPRKARHIRATVLGNNRTDGVEIAELRAYGPDQKEGAPSSPSSQDELDPGLRAELRVIECAVDAATAPAEVSGPWDLIKLAWGPDFNCRLAGDTSFGWQCGQATGVLDVNGHTLDWTTGGGNGTAISPTLVGNGGRVRWDGGFNGGWVTYPSDIRGDQPNTFNGVFELRHGTLHLRKTPGIDALAGDIEMGGKDGWNESFLVWERSDQLPESSSIITLPLAEGGKNQRATLKLWGNSDTLGGLTVRTDTVIDLGGKEGSPGAISFADSSGRQWDPAKTLTITGPGTVRFGTSAGGLTPAQLDIVRFAMPQGPAKAKINPDGTLTPR